jgi:RNA polymerase sigma-70 factor, ECF subfamily
MSERAPAGRADQHQALLALYDEALPEVYGYLVRRCGTPAVAEDLTAETFLAAVSAVRRGTVRQLTTAWLITVARNKLVDHWRRAEREERTLGVIADESPPEATPLPLDEGRALDVLQQLGPHHRLALTLRYLDGLSVPEVAAHLDRSLHATEALLVRSRRAFRRIHDAEGSDDEA